MTNKKHLQEAFKQFSKDLLTCKENREFKINATKISYEDKVGYSFWNPRETFMHNEKVRVVKPSKVTVYFGVPDVNTKQQRKLNKELK